MLIAIFQNKTNRENPPGKEKPDISKRQHWETGTPDECIQHVTIQNLLQPDRDRHGNREDGETVIGWETSARNIDT